MASTRFYGKVGYGETVEVSNGIWEDVITERSYFGDIVRNTRKLKDGESVNDDLTVNNSISIVADPYANEHFFRSEERRVGNECTARREAKNHKQVEEV